MMNISQNTADYMFLLVKKETVDHLNACLASQGKTVITTTYDDIIQEWVNWQKIKAAQEVKEQP